MTCRREALGLLRAVAAVSAITVVCFSLLHLTDAIIPALAYLLVVLFVAASARLWVALTASFVAALALNFFFLPPVGTLNIDDPEDWAAFFAFMAVGAVASRLSSLARNREQELARLFDFSRNALLEPEGDVLRELSRQLIDRFQLEYAALFLPDGDAFRRFETGDPRPRRAPDAPLLRAVSSGDIAGREGLSQPVAGVFAVTEFDRYPLWLIPLRHGTQTVGVLAVAGRRLEETTLKALASVVAMAIERARLLEQRQQSELARRSVEIKSALLASLAHDLRTPLTVMAAAISNLGTEGLASEQRRRQMDIAVAGLERLTRLFENILELARLDAGGTAPALRWVQLSEVLQAARQEVELALRGHHVNVADGTADRLVYVDPRLLATTLARLLENAAQYSPPGSTITVTSELVSGGVSLIVDDEGQGVDPEDVPHIFERFYRGSRATRHRSGSGMGLAIVQGLAQAQGGRVSVEARAGRGARFLLFVPTNVRSSIEVE